MLIGYARISKADGSQSLDLQRDALREAGVSDDAIYEDQASGEREDRPGLAAFLKAARPGDVIVVWRLDRLGRNLRHLVNLVQDLNDRDIGIRVLAGQGASIDTTTASGKLVFARFVRPPERESMRAFAAQHDYRDKAQSRCRSSRASEHGSRSAEAWFYVPFRPMMTVIPASCQTHSAPKPADSTAASSSSSGK